MFSFTLHNRLMHRHDRLVSGIGAIGVVALLGYCVIAGLNVPMRMVAEDSLILLHLMPTPPPVPESKPSRPRKMARPMRRAASAENRMAQASPVVAPPVLQPLPSVIVAAPTPGLGAAAASGASDRAGPGQGAGGVGNGPGGGGDGDGGGTPPRQIKGQLSFNDMPKALRVEGVERVVGMRYTVNVDGRVSQCIVTDTSGSAELDAIACTLIEKRFRFEPARDESGRAIRAIVEEEHSWMLERNSSGPGD